MRHHELFETPLIAAGERIDLSLPFIADSLTPLYYTDYWPRLDAAQRLTYNQINGTYWNELIAWFEKELALTLLQSIARDPGIDAVLRTRIAQFMREEMLHAAVFAHLNQISDPTRYLYRELTIVPSVAIGSLFRLMYAARLAPALLWAMLLLEERILAVTAISVRAGIEPIYARIYAAHSADEERHVSADLELLDILHVARSPRARSRNAAAFCFLLKRFLLRPGVSARRTIELFVKRHPELAPMQTGMLTAVAALRDDPRYHAMMYSREKVPRTFARFDSLPEMHAVRSVLSSYVPEPA